MIVIVFSLLIGLIYFVMLFVIRQGVKRIVVFDDTEGISAETKFSIIIPFRNEEQHLEALLKSISRIKYPTHFFEVLLIDDASEDASVEIVDGFLKHSALDIQILNSMTAEGSPKKRALQLGVTSSKYDWILTTDADCLVPENWLQTLDAFIQSRSPNMVAMPVFLELENISKIELIETLSLQLVTMGTFGLSKPTMCNGANLAFKKVNFLSLNGYEGNTHIASGDDQFLMEKFLKSQLSVLYLKSLDVIVNTYPHKDLKGFIRQRVRWAAKTKASKNSTLKLIGIVVLLMNLSLVMLLVLAMLQQVSFLVVLILFLIKVIGDLMFIQLGYKFFGIQSINVHVFLVNMYYPFVSLYIGLRSFLGRYKWKGRVFKR